MLGFPVKVSEQIADRETIMTPEERVKILTQATSDSWIALSADESKLLASSKSYSEVVKLAEAQGETEPVLIKTPDAWLDRVYSHCL